jgi:hypothetical protein
MKFKPSGDEYGTFEFEDRNCDVCLRTGGEGLWSTAAGTLRVTKLEVHGMEHENDGGAYLAGELRVHFDTKTWNTAEQGLVYTDPVFLKNLKQYLSDLVPPESQDIGYSEMGMQGRDFVSLDVGPKFIEAWKVA